MLYNGSATSLSQTDYVLEKNANSWPDIQNKTTYVLKGSKALYMRSRTKYSAIYLPSNLRANTDYTLTFSYYTDELHADGNGCAFHPISLYTTDVENSGFAYNKPGILNFYSWNVSYTSKNGIDKDSIMYHPSTSASPLLTTAGEWKEITIKFNTANFEEFALVLSSRVEHLYLDAFSLTEKVITAEEYFTDPDNWNLDQESATAIGSTTASTWTSKAKSSVTVDDTTVTALKLHSLNHRASSMLPNLKKNTEYTFSFKYYSETEASAGYIFKDMVLLNTAFDGATIGWNYSTPNGVKEYVSFNGYYIWDDYYTKATVSWDDANKTIAAEAGVPNTYSITFNTGDYENYATVLLSKVDDVYLYDFKLFDTSEPEDEPVEDPEEEVELNFEDASQWKRYSSSATNADSDPLTEDQNVWHVISENTEETDFIKEGDTSIKITPQSQYNMIKLGGLEPNTKYMLKFSYITDEMKNSSDVSKTVILNNCGIWNYGYENATFAISHVENRGYLHASKMAGNYFEIFFDSNGDYIVDWFARKDQNQQANVWYDKILFFDSADVSDTLAFVVQLEVANVYLDDFMLVALDETEEATEYSAPALGDLTAYGSYKSYKTNYTLYNGVSLEDYQGYFTTLTDAGFTEYTTNAYGENQFATFTKGNTTVNVSYNPYDSTVLIAEQITNTLPTLAKDNVYNDKGYEPAIIQIDHNAETNGGTGMSYAIRLADGSFIVVDGGMSPSNENAIRIYNTMKEYSDEEPVIAAWLLTHGHEDHICALTSFIEKYHDTVPIEQIIFNFPTLEQCEGSKSIYDDTMAYNGIAPLYLSIQALLPDTKVSTCHTGYKYHIRNAIVDIMFTLEDLFPTVFGSSYNDHNGVCTIFKVSFADENVDQSFLITGDINGYEATEMLEKYPNDELKSTFVQAVHHGISFTSGITTTAELYAKVQPEVALWPTTSNIMMSYLYQDQNQYFVNEDSVKEVIVSDYGTRALVLPYTAPEGLTGLSKFTLPSDFDSVNMLNSYVGVSIRQAGESTDAKQAIRFKFQIPEHIINAATEDGYTVSEYGMMVSEDNTNLDYYEGNKAYKTVNGSRVFKGVAYNKAADKNIVFGYANYSNLDDGVSRSTQYTCALYNIGVGSDGVTDYTKYDTTYYVRSYIVFKNADGDTKVYYGDTQSAGIFAVMQAILESTATDDQTLSDQAYVKSFLDGSISDFSEDASAIQEAWLSDSDRAALYTPAN